MYTKLVTFIDGFQNSSIFVFVECFELRKDQVRTGNETCSQKRATDLQRNFCVCVQKQHKVRIWRRLLRAKAEGGVALCFVTPKEGIGLRKKIVQLYRCRIRSPIQWCKNEIHSSPEWGARSKRMKWKSEFWVLVGWRKSEIVCRGTYNHRRRVKISGNVFWMISDRVVGLVLRYYRYKPPLLRYFIRSLVLKIIC